MPPNIASIQEKPPVVWKCDGKLCGAPISTTVQEEWDKHLRTLPHEHRGFGICQRCGAREIPFKEVHSDRNPHNGGNEIVPVFCDACLTLIAAKAKKGAQS